MFSQSSAHCSVSHFNLHHPELLDFRNSWWKEADHRWTLLWAVITRLTFDLPPLSTQVRPRPHSNQRYTASVSTLTHSCLDTTPHTTHTAPLCFTYPTHPHRPDHKRLLNSTKHTHMHIRPTNMLYLFNRWDSPTNLIYWHKPRLFVFKFKD